jgi:hypothetical protein
VQVRVKPEIAAPRMKYRGDAQLCAKSLSSGPKCKQCLRCCLEQKREKQTSILKEQRTQFRWYGEHHMKVMHRQNALFARLQPSVLRKCLTLGAVTIATRVVLRLLMATIVADLHMPAEFSRAARHDGAQHGLLFGGQAISDC